MLRFQPAHRIRCPAVTAFLLLLLPVFASGQQQSGAQGGEQAEINAPDQPLLQGFAWRSIGPAGQGGRVDDIAVDPNDVNTFYIGFATGGLWKTTNRGTTFTPIFDTYGTGSIGDLALAPSNPEVVYVGTGEANNRQSSSFGDGMYKSTDGGGSFRHVGLRATQTIARVRVHPSNPDVVWVAALGHLFGPNPERGVYKSTDGGQNWTKVLYVDENTGATDLVLNPSNPDILLAAMYQRRRTACCFVGGGPGSGIWRSEDGGESWTRLEGNGLPSGTMGRIALATTPADPSVVYAQIEVAADKAQPLTQAERQRWEHLADVDSLPPDPEWSGVWRSDDGGLTWDFRSNENGRPMYFSQIRVSSQDPDVVWVVDQRLHLSRDGGRTFETITGYGHVDQHAMWIDPSDDHHLIIGNDGAVDVTWDEGATWESLRSWAVGQPYHVSVDLRRPYHVCTGLQDNGSWCGPSSVRTGPILSQDWFGVGGGDGFYTAIDPTDPAVLYSESQNGNIQRLNLREGETERIRPRAPSENRPQETNIEPVPEPGLDIRWNWNSPFILSPFNPTTLYAGSNRFFTSRDQGATWTMSPDLTKEIDRNQVVVMGVSDSLPPCRQLDRGTPCILSKNDGVSDYSTIVSVAESPIVPGLLWAGTDDGNIQVSRDGGATWTEVSRNLPGGTTRYYVSRVEPSHFDAGTAYVSIDGHRSDDLSPYVYVTRDYGRSWTEITANLPEYGNVNTIRQDPRNPSLLYVGTEFGFFVSRDEGGSWHRFMAGLPVVRVDDVLVHPRDNDLVLATHGRSVQILDDVTPLQDMTGEVLDSTAYLFPPRDAVLWKEDIREDRAVTGEKNWTGENAPAGTFIDYYLASAPSGSVRLQITDPISGEVIRDLEATRSAGLNRVEWDLRQNPEEEGRGRAATVEPGVYRVVLGIGGTERTRTVRVLEDRWLVFP